MNQNAQPCFLLDGKTILPIVHNHQLLFSCKKLNNIEKKHCSCSLQSIEKSSEDNAKRMTCKCNRSDQQINNSFIHIFVDLTTHIIPSIDSTQSQNNQSPLAITIIIKPFISSKDHRNDTSLGIKKRKNSSSLQTTIKRISSCLSNQTLNKHRLSTFKDLTRSIPRSIHVNENQSSHILNSRTLLDIYQNKK
jgi:hypothetical protein